MTENSNAETVKTVNDSSVTVERTPKVNLKTLHDIRREMAKVYRDVKFGNLESQEGSRRVYMLAQIGKIIEVAEIELRLKTLEAAQLTRLPR